MVVNRPRLTEGSLGSTEKAFSIAVSSAGWTPRAGHSALLVTLTEERITGLPFHVLHKGRERPPPPGPGTGGLGPWAEVRKGKGEAHLWGLLSV